MFFTGHRVARSITSNRYASPLFTRTSHLSTAALLQPDAWPHNVLSPAVAVLIQNERLDWRSIAGTGKAGRIQKWDVMQALQAGSAVKLESSAPAHSATAAVADSGHAASASKNDSRMTAAGRRHRSTWFETLVRPTINPPTAASPSDVQVKGPAPVLSAPTATSDSSAFFSVRRRRQ